MDVHLIGANPNPLDAYPDHGVPGGQPSMVELSAEGLLAELTAERATLPEGTR